MISRDRLEMGMNMLTSRRVKNIVLLNLITYLLYTSVGFYVRYFSFLSLFSTQFLFFIFLPP